jgi:glycosyltransferase involved in cell wall biosynthesis
MKIALVLPGGVDRSGTHRVIPCLLWLIERLAAEHQVHVFALHQEPLPGHWPLLGAQVVNIGSRPRWPRALAAMMAEHRRGRFDVVHGFWAAGPGLAAAAFARLVGVPNILTLPGGDLAALPEIGYGARLSARGKAVVRLALAGADRVIVPSRQLGREAAALGIEAIRMPLGVAIDRWPVRRPRRRTEAVLRLVHVANLNRVKDQETLLAALHRLAMEGLDYRLDVIGLDTLNDAVQARATELGLTDRIRFHGFLPHAETRPWIEAADLLVMSSRHEAGPLVALEAALAGVPTIGTAVGHIADWAPEAALAVPVGDANALAAAVARLAADEAERLRIAHAAQALAIAEDADFTATRTLALYRELIAR